MTEQIAPGLVLAACSLAISVYDLREGRIPNSLVLVLALSGVVFAALEGTLPSALIGAGFGVLLLAATAYLFWKVRAVEGLGGGDIKLAGALGFWVGIEGIAPMILIASLAGLLMVGARALLGARIDRRTELKFGPCLCGAASLIWLLPWLDF